MRVPSPSDVVTPISLLSRVVDVADVQLLSFFHPGFKIRSEVTIMNSGDRVIYTGERVRDLSRHLTLCTKSFISVVGMPDVDLKSPEKIFEFVYSKHSKGVPKSALDYLRSSPPPEEVNRISKLIWVAGSYSFPTEGELTFFDFYKSLLRDPRSFYGVYFKLREQFAAESLEIALQTFLLKVRDPEDLGVSLTYGKLLREASGKFGKRIPGCVAALLKSNISDAESRVFFLYHNLTGL